MRNVTDITHSQNTTELKVQTPEVLLQNTTPNVQAEESKEDLIDKFDYEEFFKKDFLNAPTNLTDEETGLLEENVNTEAYEEINANSTR